MSRLCSSWGAEGMITELSPPAIRSQVINPDYFSPRFYLCFNNSVALLLPLCWEHQDILPHLIGKYHQAASVPLYQELVAAVVLLEARWAACPMCEWKRLSPLR